MTVATVRAFAQDSCALRVVVLVDQGDGRTATMLEWEPDGEISITADQTTVQVPADALLDVAPLPLDPVRAVPASAIEVDELQGEVLAPIGAVANLAFAVLDLARAFGGRSVATADFATRTAGPLTIAARDGEPIVLAVGDEQFELPVAGSGS